MLSLNKPARAVKAQASSPDEAPKPTQQDHAKRALALKRAAPTERPLDRLLSMQKAAEQLGVHVATIRRLIASKKLVAVRVADRKIGIRVSSIEAHLAANEIAAEDFTA
jgi:excisionase family DNA binding protein